MSRLKSWWTRTTVDPEYILIAMVFMAFALLIIVALVPLMAHAGACLVIEVPPQAVTWVQDGDTFTLFNFAPGGAVKIRVSNVNTPEKKEPKFEEARQFTRDWLAKGKFIVDTCGEYTFEQIQAVVTRDGETLAKALHAAGLGK
jgi:endonuclease YncB( thermonuclease family)